MSNSPHSCPLCPVSMHSQKRLYSHLLVSHRKSEIVSKLLAEQTGQASQPSSPTLVSQEVLQSDH